MLDVQQLKDQFAEKVGVDLTHALHIAQDEIILSLPAEELLAATHVLHEEFGATFADLFARVEQGMPERAHLHLILALDTQQNWVHLVVPLAGSQPLFSTLTTLFPAARWYEREIWEEVGILPEDHQGLRGLRLPSNWPQGVLPHHPSFSWSQKPPQASPRAFALEEAPSGVVDYPLGPVRSGVVESGHYTLRTVGEELLDLHLQLFYKHRGVEKRAEGLSLPLLPLLAERISGTSAVAHALALCQALERAAGIEVPRRARFVRTLLAEIERLYNHLGYQADLCQATGLVVAQAQFEILKERLLRVNAQISGHRYLFGTIVPGGISLDLSAETQTGILSVIREVQHEFERLRKLLLASPSHLDRLEGTGILQPSDAASYSALGPIGRASGVDRDLRRDHPYAAYDELNVEVPVVHDGDAFARARIRLEESAHSCHLIEQVLTHLPDGPIHVVLPDLPAGTSALGWSESAHGESLHWIRMGEQGKLSQYRVRPASFANWQAFPLCVPGHNILTDFPVIEQSFGLSFAGADC
jgi:formate hydrogenlyase subunit 5